MESFANKLRLENWQDVLSSDNGSETFKLFYTKFCTLYDNAFPVKHVKTGYKTKKIWLSDGLRKSIKIKNRIYMKQLRSPCEEYTREYKRYKSCLNRLMRNAERNHYKDILDKNRNNTKKLWGILKDIINKKKSTTRPKQFVIGDEVVTNKNIIADKFNDYFTNVGSNLAEKIPSVNIDPITYIRGSFPSSLFLQDVERFEVERIIRALKHSSAGYDGIHAKVLKHIYRLIIEPLTHVLHLSISQGFFPNEMKLAKIIPLYKSGDTIHIGNYRPVSVLPIFSKLLERLMYNRVFSFININNILYKYQFGFREKHSTNLALITLIDKIASAIDNGDMFLGVFLDFKKAFDTVNHNILLHKLFKYGIRGIAFNWFQDYLRGRKQFVSFNDAESSRLTIKCGVPQGSILGPLLFFIIY